jgi:site-specific DNA recombinase
MKVSVYDTPENGGLEVLMGGERKAKAVAYVRVSTADQAREGWSLTAQRKRVRAYCEARGWRLVKVYADEGVSSAARRPAFEAMVDDVLADGVEAIVAMKLDRLGRSAAGLLSLYERLERKGVRIVTIEDGIDTSTANGRLMRTILAALAEWERDIIRDRTRNGVRAAMDDGRRVGQPPYGYTVRDGRLVERLDEQQILRRIRARHGDGASLATIARELNAAKVSARRGRWHPTSIARALDA